LPWSIHARGLRSKVLPRGLAWGVLATSCRGALLSWSFAREAWRNPIRPRAAAASPSGTTPRIRSPDESPRPSCPWSPARNAPAHIGRGAVRSCRSGAGFPYARKCQACPHPW